MRTTFRYIAGLMIVAQMLTSVSAQVSSDVWRNVAEKIDAGTEVQVRLQGGQRFRATFVGINDQGVLLQPKTRIPVPVQQVAYDAIVSLERAKGGSGAGKAAAIGIATGAAAFWGMLLLALAVWGD